MAKANTDKSPTSATSASAVDATNESKAAIEAEIERETERVYKIVRDYKDSRMIATRRVLNSHK